MPDVSVAQLRVIDGAAAVAATFSFLGSALILWHTSSWKGVRYRLLFGLSAVDLLASAKLIFFSIFFHEPIGDRTPSASCSAEGFLRVWLDTAAPLYNSTLSLFFLLVIRYHFKTEQLIKIEWFLHCFPIFTPLVFATIGLVGNVYAPGQGATVCGPKPYPPGCEESDKIQCTNDDIDFRYVYIPTLLGGPLFAWHFILATTILIVHSVCKNDKVYNQNFTGTIPANPRQSSSAYRHTRRVAGQAFQWVFCFFITYIFGLSYVCFRYFDQEFTFANLFWLAVVANATLALQGAADAIVFFRPRYLLFRRNARIGRLRSLVSTLFTRCKPPTTTREDDANTAVVLQQERHSTRRAPPSIFTTASLSSWFTRRDVDRDAGGFGQENNVA